MVRPLPTAMALNPEANQFTGPAYSAKVYFMAVGGITTTIKKAGRPSQ